MFVYTAGLNFNMMRLAIRIRWDIIFCTQKLACLAQISHFKLNSPEPTQFLNTLYKVSAKIKVIGVEFVRGTLT